MITTVKFAKTREDAIIPTKNFGDAGYDVYARFDEKGVTIEPNQTKLLDIGIATACDPEYYIQAHERGSTGKIGLKVSASIIDSSYRGSIFVALTNCNTKPIIICKDQEQVLETESYIYYPYDKAIAQLIVHPIPEVEAEEYTYEELKTIPSERGDGCIGSSGK